jgi:hypothetical protein
MELEKIDPEQVLQQRLHPESKKIHEWENSSEDLETDAMMKKKTKAKIEQELNE